MRQIFLTKTLLVIEDNKQAKEHLVEILELYFKQVISFEDGCEAIEKINTFIPDIIVSDIKMPCLDGMSFIKKVKTENYKPIIIFTTAFSDKEYLLEALNMKVDGYLIKPINIDTLLNKIADALGSFENINLKYKILSDREYEVFLDLSKGLKPLEIALKYGIKSKTISTYRRRIFEKMGFLSNAELISYAIKNKLN
jgi:DNA-binding NarL/FixJ family response regulator